MSQGLRESLLSYQLSRTERRGAPSSSTTESSAHSPLESGGSHAPRMSTRSRPPLLPRPHSSDQRTKERIRVQVIEERAGYVQSFDVKQRKRSLHISRSSEGPQPQVPIDVGGSLGRKAVVHHISSSSVPRTPEPHETPSPASIVKERKSRPSWARTRSGGVWYQRNTSSHENSSARSANSVLSKADDGETKSIGIVPMKPPPRPARLESAPTNHIIIETPFGPHKDTAKNVKGAPTALSTEERRPSSTEVRRIISAPFKMLRQSLKGKSSRLPTLSPADTRASHTPLNSASHRPFLRRDQTARTLDRVSSILEGHGRAKMINWLRVGTNKPVSSASSSDPNDSRQSHNRFLAETFHIAKNRSVEQIADKTSSILNIHMGSTPQNSPTEKATYRIKKSPSAESEEFLKIDISIRGGTSYLASEARRISTPPLPSTPLTGFRRGFFFNYNAPGLDESCNEIHSTSQLTHRAGTERLTNLTSTKIGHHVPVASARVQRSTSMKTAQKHNTGDWYDTKLADIDASSLDIDLTTTSEAEMHPQCKHDHQARLAEIKRQKYEAQLDYNIPEHLPNSPLCPRNPRYWRVKEQKGSQFRGCWMHGFGERDVVPGLQ